ncbi:MAG: hypothetical protein AABY61_05970 [Nitrospirota bacterium]
MPISVVEQNVGVQDHAPSILLNSHDTPPSYSIRQLLASRYHAFWYHLGERFAWSRGAYRERPVRRLSQLSGIQQARIASLQRRFRVGFERQAEQSTALKQYDYLEVLERTWSALGLPYSVGGAVQDMGSSNFWYAAALHAFFQPSELVGVEVEGHRIYTNGYSRLDYAHGYIQNLPNTQFIVGDYAGYDHPADVVTAWYPFVTPGPVLAWRMPLSVLTPHALFSRVARNLTPHGLFVMVNQGRDEAAIAAAWCEKVGLVRYGSYEVRTLLRSRRPAVVSCWTSAHASHTSPYQN